MSDMLQKQQEIISSIDKIYDSVQRGDVQKGMQLFPEFIEILQQFMNTFIRENVVSNKQNILKVNEVLKQVMGAMQKQDYFMMSDIMQYELKPLIEKWEHGGDIS